MNFILAKLKPLLLFMSLFFAQFVHAQLKLKVQADSAFVFNSSGKTLFSVDGAGRLKMDSAADGTADTYLLTWDADKKVKKVLKSSIGGGSNSFLTGVSGGQTAIGGTATGDSLRLSSTVNTTKGKILIGTSVYNEATNRLGLGTTSPSAPLHIVGVTNGVQQIIKLPSSQTQANPIWQVLDSAGRILVELRAQTNIRSNGLRSVNQFFGDSSGINTIVAEGVDSGAYNSGFGYKALASNVRGKANTAIGSEALKDNVTGSFNSGFGQGALMSMISGSDNLGIGQKSLPTYTTGNQNVGIGNNIADGNLSGSDNVMIGNSAGRTPNGTGNQNVFIGSSAGRGTSTTASGNVLIGYNVGNGLTVGNNKLYIANSNTSTPLIYGEFDNNVLATSGRLGVGTQTPEQKLHVKGQVKIDTIATSTNGTDSVLAVNNSLVKKVAFGYGTYTPSVSNQSAISGTTVAGFQYTRIGNMVTLSGKINLGTISNIFSSLDLSLPISSSFTQDSQLAGSAANTSGVGLTVSANTANGQMKLNISDFGSIGSGTSIWFTAQYQIL